MIPFRETVIYVDGKSMKLLANRRRAIMSETTNGSFAEAFEELSDPPVEGRCEHWLIDNVTVVQLKNRVGKHVIYL